MEEVCGQFIDAGFRVCFVILTMMAGYGGGMSFLVFLILFFINC